MNFNAITKELTIIEDDVCAASLEIQVTSSLSLAKATN